MVVVAETRLGGVLDRVLDSRCLSNLSTDSTVFQTVGSLDHRRLSKLSVGSAVF